MLGSVSPAGLNMATCYYKYRPIISLITPSQAHVSYINQLNVTYDEIRLRTEWALPL